MAYIEILTVLILTIANGLLAMSEMAIASSRLPKLRSLVESGVRGSRRALVLASDPGRFLSTVQIGITLIGILAGAVSGASLGGRATLFLEGYGIPQAVAEPLGFGLVISAITYVSLILGELVPKQIALHNPERMACLVAPAMTLLARISSPVVWLLNRSGKLVLRLLGQHRVRQDVVSDAEIHSLIAEAEEAGVIHPTERNMISGVMRLGDRLVRSIMVPRADVKGLELNTSPAEIGKQFAESGHSRLVVYKDAPDNVVGVLQAKDVGATLLRNRKFQLSRAIKQAPTILDTMDALDAMSRLKESEVHFGLVYDEYGHFEGIVTTADILEAIVGAFRQERQELDPEIVEREDGSLLVAGWTDVDILADRLNLRLPEKRSYNTVAGLMLEYFGHLPKTGESVERGKHRFEVVDLDGRRIDKVLVQGIPSGTRRSVHGIVEPGE